MFEVGLFLLMHSSLFFVFIEGGNGQIISIHCGERSYCFIYFIIINILLSCICVPLLGKILFSHYYLKVEGKLADRTILVSFLLPIIHIFLLVTVLWYGKGTHSSSYPRLQAIPKLTSITARRVAV